MRAPTIRDALLVAPVHESALSAEGRFVAALVPAYDARADARPAVLHVLDLDGDGRWVPIGHVDERLHDVSFSEDGRLAAFRSHGDVADIAIYDPRTPDEPGRHVPHMPPGASVLKWWGRPARLSVLGFDGAGVRRLWVWDDLDDRPRVASPPRLSVGDHAFAPGSDRLAWIEAPAQVLGGPELGGTLWWTSGLGRRSVPVATPEPMLGFLVWSPDGRHVAGMARPRGEVLCSPRLWVVTPETGEARRLGAELEGWITSVDWCPDGRSLLVCVDQGVEGRIWRLHLDGTREAVGPAGVYASGARSDRRTGRVIYLRQDSHEPQHLRLIEPGGTDRRLSAFDRKLAGVTRVPSATVTWTADDGLPLEGLLLVPGDTPAPVVVWLHGGPAEHLQRTFSMVFQLMVAQGWAVFAPNFRGSTGRSDAFLRALSGHLGRADVSDVLGGVQSLDGRVDTSRVAFVGWSYGGTLALQCAAARRTTRAVVAGAPVADWLTVFGARAWPSVTLRYFPSPPWVDTTAYDEASVVRRLGEVNAPVLFLHGEADERVPVSHSRLLYRLLQARRVPTDLRLFPSEGHVFVSPWAVREMLARTLAWLETHLEAPNDPTGRVR